MHILLLSPYHSGSHQAWAEGLQKHSQHSITLLTLPGESWKWRMHGAAVTLSAQIKEMKLAAVDLVLVDDMFDLATFIALTRRELASARFGLYMHENQLLYPLSQDKRKGPMRRNMGVRERQYVLINWKSMLAADHIFFNSRYHLDTLLAELPMFLKHYQSFNEAASVDQIYSKSSVLPVGIDLTRLAPPPTDLSTVDQENPPLILWNQRWEFDKNPAQFCRIVEQIAAEGLQFRLAICGERFSRSATEAGPFDALKENLSDRIVHFGYASSKEYWHLLWQADIIISTAKHEFFGISIVEAIYCHSFPILPERLSYPELIPSALHESVLYRSEEELKEKLRWAILDSKKALNIVKLAASHLEKYDWPQIIGQYDQKIKSIVQNDH